MSLIGPPLMNYIIFLFILPKVIEAVSHAEFLNFLELAWHMAVDLELTA